MEHEVWFEDEKIKDLVVNLFKKNNQENKKTKDNRFFLVCILAFFITINKQV